MSYHLVKKIVHEFIVSYPATSCQMFGIPYSEHQELII